MKAPTILVTIIVAISALAAKAEEQFINVSATATIADKPYSTPTGTVKSGHAIQLTYPTEKSEISVSATPTLKNGVLHYLINTKIPSEDGKSYTESTSNGITDTSKPITYEFFAGGKRYSISVVLIPATRDGEQL